MGIISNIISKICLVGVNSKRRPLSELFRGLVGVKFCRANVPLPMEYMWKLKSEYVFQLQ